MSLTVSASGVAPEYGVQEQSSKPKTTSSVFKHSAQENKAPEKAAYGKKSEAWQTNFRQKLKNEYQITVRYDYSYSLGKNVKVYDITAKKDVNLAQLKEELGIKNGVISNNNAGYGQYDYNGHYIENKPMKGVLFHIPVNSLGEEIDERSFLDKLKNILGF